MKKLFSFITLLSMVFICSFAGTQTVSFDKVRDLPINAYGTPIPADEVNAFLNTTVLVVPEQHTMKTRMVSENEDPTIVTVQNVIDWAAKAATQLNLPTFISLLLIAIGNVISFVTSFISWLKERKKRKE